MRLQNSIATGQHCVFTKKHGELGAGLRHRAAAALIAKLDLGSWDEEPTPGISQLRPSMDQVGGEVISIKACSTLFLHRPLAAVLARPVILFLVSSFQSAFLSLRTAEQPIL